MIHQIWNMATSNVLVVKEDAPDDASTSLPNTSNIRISLSPILDFGTRRNFCNIVECAYCRSHAEDHRLSPIRSPMKSPSSRFFFYPFLYFFMYLVPFRKFRTFQSILHMHMYILHIQYICILLHIQYICNIDYIFDLLPTYEVFINILIRLRWKDKNSDAPFKVLILISTMQKNKRNQVVEK